MYKLSHAFPRFIHNMDRPISKTISTRVFNKPEFLGRHDFQAKKFGRKCTKSGSHAVPTRKIKQIN